MSYRLGSRPPISQSPSCLRHKKGSYRQIWSSFGITDDTVGDLTSISVTPWNLTEKNVPIKGHLRHRTEKTLFRGKRGA